MSRQIKRHEAVSESEMRRIFKRKKDNMNRLSEEGLNTVPVQQPVLRSSNEGNEITRDDNLQKISSNPTRANICTEITKSCTGIVRVSTVVPNVTNKSTVNHDSNKEEKDAQGNEDGENDRDEYDEKGQNEISRVHAGNQGDPGGDPDSSSSDDDRI